MGSSTSCVHSPGILPLFIFGVMSKLLLYNQAVGEAFGIKVSLRISQQPECCLEPRDITDLMMEGWTEQRLDRRKAGEKEKGAQSQAPE